MLCFVHKWWDYADDFMNLNGRISIFFSFCLGNFALIFIHYVHPFFEKKLKPILKKIPKELQLLMLNVCFIILIIDTVLSSIKYLNIRYNLALLYFC